MSGLRTGRMQPMELRIEIDEMVEDASHGPGIKKKSRIFTDGRELGGDLKLGVVLPTRHRIARLVFRAGTGFGQDWPCRNITTDPDWGDLRAALEEHLPAAEGQHWQVFDIPEGLIMGFVSEMIVTGRPDAVYPVPVRVVHAAESDDLRVLRRRFLTGEYGRGDTEIGPPRPPKP